MCWKFLVGELKLGANVLVNSHLCQDLVLALMLQIAQDALLYATPTPFLIYGLDHWETQREKEHTFA